MWRVKISINTEIIKKKQRIHKKKKPRHDYGRLKEYEGCKEVMQEEKRSTLY